LLSNWKGEQVEIKRKKKKKKGAKKKKKKKKKCLNQIILVLKNMTRTASKEINLFQK
jgi:hypothetical protein